MDGINLWLLDVISLRPGLSVLFLSYLPKVLCIARNAQVMLIQSFEVPFKSRILFCLIGPVIWLNFAATTQPTQSAAPFSPFMKLAFAAMGSH